MSKEYSFKDAKRPLTIHVTEADIKGAVPGDGRNCVMSRAIQREHKCFDVILHRTVAYVRKSENSVPLRYQVSQPIHDLLVSWDAAGRAWPIVVTFLPPRWGMSTERNRSPAIREAKRRARAKAKRRKEVLRRKAYTKLDPLTLMGVRNGKGVRPLGSGKLRNPQPRV